MTIVDYIKKSDIEDIVKLFFALDDYGYVNIIDDHKECKRILCEFLDIDCDGCLYCDRDDAVCPHGVEGHLNEIEKKQILDFLTMDVDTIINKNV